MRGILHFSDIHFGCENKAAVAAAAAFAHDGDFQVIAITGDITQYGAHDEFKAAAAWVKTLPGPVLMTPGNHDTPYAGIVDRVVAPFTRYERYFGPAHEAAFDGDDVAVRAFNSSRGAQIRLNWSKGAVHHRDAQRTADALAHIRPGALRVAACHHPLMEVTGGPMTGNVRGGREASGILAKAHVDLVLTGHVHIPFTLSLPCDDGCTHGVGAATLSMRERGMPAGFNIIEWDADTVEVRAQGWTGSHFETIRTWALPRRKAG